MINEKFIPSKEDQEATINFLRKLQELEKNIDTHIRKRYEAEDEIEEFQRELQELNTQLTLDSSEADIENIRKKKQEIMMKLEDLRTILSIDVDSFIKSKLDSDEFKDMKSQMAVEYGQWSKPLIDERERMKEEYQKDMEEIESMLFKGEYNQARKLELKIKHKGKNI